MNEIDLDNIECEAQDCENDAAYLDRGGPLPAFFCDEHKEIAPEESRVPLPKFREKVADREPWLNRLLYRVCPHWWWPVPDYGHPFMYVVTKRERCRFCGKHRIHARVPEPHPTRDKDEELAELQQPGFELVVEEWLPYGSMGPPSRDELEGEQ